MLKFWYHSTTHLSLWCIKVQTVMTQVQDSDCELEETVPAEPVKCQPQKRQRQKS